MSETPYAPLEQRGIRIFHVELAEVLGLLEACIISQIDFRLKYSKYQFFGRRWWPCSYQKWAEELPPFSSRTIKRAMDRLREDGYIYSECFRKGSQLFFWSINHEKCNEIIMAGVRRG